MDIFTFIEHRGSIQGKTVAWVGDGNNMCATWLQAAELLDFKVNISTPSDYNIDPAKTNIRVLTTSGLKTQWTPAKALTW